MKKVCIFAFILTGCGQFAAKGGTTHVISGEATINVVLSVDLTICDQFTNQTDKLECVKALLDLAKTAKDQDEEAPLPGFSGV